MQAGEFHPIRVEPVAGTASAKSGRWILFFTLVVALLGLAVVPSQACELPKDTKDAPKAEPEDQGQGPEREFDLWRRSRLKKDDRVYKLIKDDQPKNAAEAPAYEVVVEHARTCPTEALETRSQRYVEYGQLTSEARIHFLRELLQIKGRLTRIRKLDAAKWLKHTPESELYEGVINFDEAGRNPVYVNFTELPELPGFELDKDLKTPVIFDGYYFKLLKLAPASGEEDGKSVPLLIGRTIRIDEREQKIADASADPEKIEATMVQLNKEDYTTVKDRQPLQSRLENNGEYTAYGLTFMQAHKFSPEVLSRQSRKDFAYGDLIGGLRERYLRELLHVEGRLVRLRKLDAPERLRDTTEIKEIYEAWIYSKYQPEHPIVLTFTDLPPDISLGEQLSYRVAFDGYYFKLLKYQSREKDKDGRPQMRVAPLLIGKNLQLVETGSSMWSLSSSFMPLVLTVIGSVVAVVLGLSIWFRRNDQRMFRQMQGSMAKTNPFEEPPATIQPGAAWNRLNDPPSAN